MGEPLPRRSWLSPWPALAETFCDCHLATPSRLALFVRDRSHGAFRRAVVYDARTLTTPPTCGLAEPCQVLRPASVSRWGLRLIHCLQGTSRLLGRPVVVVVYAGMPRSSPADPRRR